MRDLIKALSEVATVILDAPPLLSVTDAAIIGTIADGVLITVGVKQVTDEQLEKSYRAVTRVNGKVLGAVLNKIPPKGVDSHDYGYYRTKYYTSNDAEADASPHPGGPAENAAKGPETRSRKALRAAR
jgi:Mrp family chromosome partitioning ATPase